MKKLKFKFCNLNVYKVPFFELSRVSPERRPRNEKVRLTQRYAVITENNIRSKKYIHIPTCVYFSGTASSPNASLIGSLLDASLCRLSSSANSWKASSSDLSAESSSEVDSSVLFSFKLGTITHVLRAKFVLKRLFFAAVAGDVKLLSFLIASNTSPDCFL